MNLHDLFLGELSLVEDSDSMNEFAEILKIRSWQEIKEQARPKDKDVRQVLLCLVTARDPLCRISGRYVKRTWEIRCHGSDSPAMPFPHITLQDCPSPRRLVVRRLALNRATPKMNQ